MLGILSSTKKNETHLKFFSHILNTFNEYKNKSLFIFTMNDIDFSNKKIKGNLITKDGIEFSKISIPSITFNLTDYSKRSSRKKVEQLALYSNIVNEANRFKQYMIMEMLSSNKQTHDFLLKYEIDIKKIIEKSFFIVDDKSYNYSKIKKLSRKQEFVMFNKQDLLLSNNYPVIITLYVQRGIGGEWKVLPGTQKLENIKESDTLYKKINFAAIESTAWISCFIPSLSFSTVNFVLDNNLNPYLISLNGWDPKILRENSHNHTGIEFMKNLFDYTNFLNIEQKRGVNLVD